MISNSSSTFSSRSGRLDHNHLLADDKRVKSSETGVAVITNNPNIKTMMRTTFVSSGVINQSRGFVTPLPSHPPRSRIFADSRKRSAKPVDDRSKVSAPIMILPVAFVSSGTRNNLIAK